MTTDNPSSLPQAVQPTQYNFMQSVPVSVADASHCLNCSLSYISIQDFDSLGHLEPGIDYAGPYPAMNYVNTLPPTRYTNSMGHDNTHHLATVRVRLQFSCPPPFLTVALLKGPAEQRENQGQGQHSQCIPMAPGPHLLAQYAPAIPVRVLPSSISSPCVDMQPF